MRNGCQQERVPQWITFERGIHNGGAVGGEAEMVLSERVPLDTIIYGVLAEAFTDPGDPNPPARSLAFAFNIRDSRDEQWWYQTLPNAGGLVPAALIAGTIGEPYLWPEPRIVRRGSTLELRVKADFGLSLCQLRIAFLGQRMGIDREGRVADEAIEFDARDAGYQAVVVTSPAVSLGPTRCAPGPEVNQVFPIGSKSYSSILQEAALIAVNPAAPMSPLTDVYGELRIRDTSISHTLVGNGRFIPFSYFGGSTGDSDIANVVRPLASRLGSDWRIRQDAAFEIDWRLIYAPVSSVNVIMAFHGVRAPVVGRAASAQEIAERTRFFCPPGMREHIDMPYPGGR